MQVDLGREMGVQEWVFICRFPAHFPIGRKWFIIVREEDIFFEEPFRVGTGSITLDSR